MADGLGKTGVEPAGGLSDHPWAWRKDDLDVALMGAGRAIQAVAAVLLMVDPRDLGLVTQVRSPHQEAPTIYLYEAVPGGIGLSERLFARHDELVTGALGLIEACSCDSGCPACTGPRLDPDVDAKRLAIRFLTALATEQGERPGAPGGRLLGRPRAHVRKLVHDPADGLVETGPRVPTQIGRA